MRPSAASASVIRSRSSLRCFVVTRRSTQLCRQSLICRSRRRIFPNAFRTGIDLVGRELAAVGQQDQFCRRRFAAPDRLGQRDERLYAEGNRREHADQLGARDLDLASNGLFLRRFEQPRPPDVAEIDANEIDVLPVGCERRLGPPRVDAGPQIHQLRRERLRLFFNQQPPGRFHHMCGFVLVVIDGGNEAYASAR